LEQLEARTLLSAELISAANPHLLSASGGRDSFLENTSSISADGRFVVFESLAANLTPIPTNGHENIFVRDLLSGMTTLVSVNASGTAGGAGDSTSPIISANGRFVAFDSSASDLVANDTNGNVGDVFVRDLVLGTTTLVSANLAGTGSGNGPSGVFSRLAISADGRFVEFDSFASDLVTQATNNLDNIYVRDLAMGTTSLVSVNQAGTAGGDESTFSFMTTMSADGRFVAFQSEANDLVPNDTNGPFTTDVFVRDLVSGVTSLVSVNQNGTASGNDRSFGASISANGRFVVFQSAASDLVSNDTNGTIDVFVRDLVQGTTTLVSVNASGTASGNSESTEPSISADGRRIAFVSIATDLTPGVQNPFGGQVYVRDLDSQTTTLVSVNDSGTGTGNGTSNEPEISADGQSVAFDTDQRGSALHAIADIGIRKAVVISWSCSKVRGIAGEGHESAVRADHRPAAARGQRRQARVSLRYEDGSPGVHVAREHVETTVISKVTVADGLSLCLPCCWIGSKARSGRICKRRVGSRSTFAVI
jgi:Tol biopolymer transport system component